MSRIVNTETNWWSEGDNLTTKISMVTQMNLETHPVEDSWDDENFTIPSLSLVETKSTTQISQVTKPTTIPHNSPSQNEDKKPSGKKKKEIRVFDEKTMEFALTGISPYDSATNRLRAIEKKISSFRNEIDKLEDDRGARFRMNKLCTAKTYLYTVAEEIKAEIRKIKI